MAAVPNDVNQYLLVYSCVYCQYQTNKLNKYLSHLEYVHQTERGFSVTCGIGGCQKKYSIVESLSRHIRRNHNINIHVGQPVAIQPARPNDSDGDESDDEYMQVQEGINNEENVDPEENAQYDYLRTIALFILRLKEERKVPANACTHIVREINKLFEINTIEVRNAVSKVLEENGIDQRNIDGFEDIFTSFHSVSAATNVLNTTKKQDKYFTEQFDFVEPEEILLGHDETGKSETYMYIPIKKLLQCLLKHDDVLAEVQGKHASSDGNLRDFCDGDAYKNHPIFSLDEPTLQINLYHDDFQVVNPLGNRVKKYKISAFYFLLGNLPPKYRSKLSAVQTLILCQAHLVKKYGYSVIMQRLIDDLKSLETDGVSVIINGEEHTFIGTLGFVIADNLAAHSLSGLLESFSADRTCRFCMVTKDQRQVVFVDRELQLRTKEAHNIHVRNVALDPNLSSAYGVKSDSPLNKLDYFHCIWGCPSDIAHDMFEGFSNEVMEHIIRYFVQESYFTLPELNQKIRTFEYAECDKANKPWPFADELGKFKVKLTASQCYCFIRLLPLMVSEWVPSDDSCLQLLCDLLDIVDYIVAHTIHPGELLLLDEMISTFHQKYYAEFEDSVTPKAHYLIHYARQMKLFGPLVHCQTLRCESKHNYYKEIANRTKNRKNMCRTLAYRNQYQQCLYHTSPNFLSDDNVQDSKGGLFPVRLLANKVQDLLAPLLGTRESVYQAESVTVDGVKYSAGSCVVHEFDDEICDTFIFGSISIIFVIGGNAYLLTEVLETEEFRQDIHAYIVTKSDQLTCSYRLCRVTDLLDFHPLGLYHLQGPEYAIILKYWICK